MGMRQKTECHHSIPYYITVVEWVSSCSSAADEVFCSNLPQSCTTGREIEEESKVTFEWNQLLSRSKSLWEKSTHAWYLNWVWTEILYERGLVPNKAAVWWVLNGQANRKDIMKAQQWSRTHCPVIHECDTCPGSLHHRELVWTSSVTSLY